MGQSQSIVTQIEIAASPETVRAVFLDFQRYKEWHQDWTFESLNPSVQPADLKPEDRIRINLKGTVFKPVVVEKYSRILQWREGSLGLLLTAKHQFYFSPDPESPKKTILVQKEDFSGLLTFLFRPGWSLRKQTADGFEIFNKDLKATIENNAQN